MYLGNFVKAKYPVKEIQVDAVLNILAAHDCNPCSILDSYMGFTGN